MGLAWNFSPTSQHPAKGILSLAWLIGKCRLRETKWPAHGHADIEKQRLVPENSPAQSGRNVLMLRSQIRNLYLFIEPNYKKTALQFGQHASCPSNTLLSNMAATSSFKCKLIQIKLKHCSRTPITCAQCSRLPQCSAQTGSSAGQGGAWRLLARAEQSLLPKGDCPLPNTLSLHAKCRSAVHQISCQQPHVTVLLLKWHCHISV